MSAPRFRVEHDMMDVGRAHGDVEAAIVAAKRLAVRKGERVEIHRDFPNREMIATVWPDGKVDLTPAGAEIA